MLWELVTGDLDAPRLPRDTPSDLRAVIEGLLIGQPRRRWSAARALRRLRPVERAVGAAELGRLARRWLDVDVYHGGDPEGVAMSDSEASAAQHSEADAAPPWRRRRVGAPGIAALAVASALAGAVGTWAVVTGRERTRATAAQPAVSTRADERPPTYRYRQASGTLEEASRTMTAEAVTPSRTGAGQLAEDGEPGRTPAAVVATTVAGERSRGSKRRVETLDPAEEHGVEVVSGVSGMASEIWAKYEQGDVVAARELSDGSHVFVYRGRRAEGMSWAVSVVGDYLPVGVRVMVDGYRAQGWRLDFRAGKGVIVADTAPARGSTVRMMLYSVGGTRPVTLEFEVMQ
ncbi:hypothetical protein [Haliangium sp.]|uniref:hypothetical protein n=1 Tax=Haliangium sp. TaxID=2663208 RepID=UPI003D14B0CA